MFTKESTCNSLFQIIATPPWPRGIFTGCIGSLSSTDLPIPIKYQCNSFKRCSWEITSQCSWIRQVSIFFIMSFKNGSQVKIFLQLKVTILKSLNSFCVAGVFEHVGCSTFSMSWGCSDIKKNKIKNVVKNEFEHYKISADRLHSVTQYFYYMCVLLVYYGFVRKYPLFVN